MFVRSLIRRSLNHNYSLPTQRVFAQEWLNSIKTSVACSVLPFKSQGKLSDECTWRRMSLASRNLYNLPSMRTDLQIVFFEGFKTLMNYQLNLSLHYFVYVYPCRIVVGCWLVYSLLILHCYCIFCYCIFFTDVVAIFLFIRWSCTWSCPLFLFLELLFIILTAPFHIFVTVY